MKFYFSSMYIKEQIDTLDDLLEKISPNAIQLHLDTNICIYLREFIREPSKTVSNVVLWEELRNLLRVIEQYDLEVDYSLGVEESCRDLGSFAVNEEKLSETLLLLNKLFKMDFLQMLDHSKLIQFSDPVKDKTQRQTSKGNSLEQQSVFQRLMYVSYACLLKLYQLYYLNSEMKNIDKMIFYLDFLANEVNLMSMSHIIYGHLLLSGHPKARKLIHSDKKTVEHIFHSIWNASLDLTFPTLVSQKFVSDKMIPVFVTRDEVLWLIFDSMKMRFMITDGNKSAQPPFMEMNLSKTKWTSTELRIINKYHMKIQRKRLYAFINREESIETQINKIKKLCFDLENTLKASLCI
ncbi:hypothetical protein [Cohnella soli]|uniref:Uncharacterized protein n=1 Tax=Cohnella soli TaxID=425005 RepID=A0ABW0I2K6_9BACL